MISFERFLDNLGVQAQEYSAEELRAFHAEVQTLAEILQMAVQSERSRREKHLSTPTAVDETYQDRTVEKTNSGPNATGQSAP